MMSSTTTDEDSSIDSPSASASPEASVHAAYTGPPNLARLIGHLVAAKQALNSSSHVYRATELVTVSRSLVEDIAVLGSRNAFATQALDAQVRILTEVRQSIIDDCGRASDEFTVILESLDKADLRLKTTLGTLRETIIDASLQRRNVAALSNNIAGQEDGADAGASVQRNDEAVIVDKTLFDFIDENTHENLLRALYGLIDTYHDARGELDDSLKAFERSLQAIDFSLRRDNGVEDKRTIYDEPPATLEEVFRSLESHATDIAALLQNLVNHYDLCVTALKHTEGGGEAARQAMQASDGLPKDAQAAESLYDATGPAEPMTDAERTEMLTVLENDALEVEEVVIDIQSLASEMESQFSVLQKRTHDSRLRNKSLRGVLDMLHELRRVDANESLPKFLAAARIFVSVTWPALHAQLEAKTHELLDLCSFYEQFRESYALLLEEARRRELSANQIEKVALKAQRDLQKMYDAESIKRDDFMKDVGGFLPRDIWAGLSEVNEDANEVQWEVRKR